MKYELLPTKVSIVFYRAPKQMAINHRIISFLISALSHADLHHSGIMLQRDDNSIILAANKYHRAKFIDQEGYHRRVVKPAIVVELGELTLSIKQLIAFIKEPYRGDDRRLLFYTLIGQFLFPGITPKSCSILSCQLLRIAGYHIKDCFTPIQLYNEVKTKGTVKSWQEFAEDNNLRS